MIKQIKDKKIQILFSNDQIQNRINKLANIINLDYKNEKELVAICVLKGAFMFFTDLVRRLTIDQLYTDFIQVSSYGNNMQSSGNVKLIKDITLPIEGKNVLIVEDIIDTGLTMKFLIEKIKEKNPKSIKIATLLATEGRKDMNINYIGFTIPNDMFVIGYGLDLQETVRNWNDIYYVIK